jgi:hypothetical protein
VEVGWWLSKWVTIPILVLFFLYLKFGSKEVR